ncbi:transposase [Petroclostridium sp. X23]|uniref:transposase n=1 Tax=Petroclostridium sp. X23 TaxID=3045146 RepID=UPI0024ADA8DC|nr:transposase [Petroclostridium sp. X23]WHH57726.1 transposase [Petroclostridium sp. X23]
MGNTRSYDKDFKKEVLRLINEAGKSVAEVGKELDIPATTIHGWIKQAKKHKDDAFPSKGNLHESDVEIVKLRKGNAELKMELEILKKATAIFIKDQR